MSSDFSKGLVWAGESSTRPDGSTYRHPDGGDEQQIVAEVADIESDILGRRFKSLINDNVGTLPVGTPVYLKSTVGHMDAAKADAASTGQVIGLVSDVAGIAPSVAGKVQVEGEVTLTTAQWDAITDGSGGLTVGAPYYLDAADAGELTATAPSAASSVAAMVGIALSSTVLKLRFSAALVVHA